jgi:hypothetical protein
MVTLYVGFLSVRDRYGYGSKLETRVCYRLSRIIPRKLYFVLEILYASDSIAMSIYTHVKVYTFYLQPIQ